MSKLLPVHEVFTSIQGEGSLIGTPSTFIRLAGCNLRCRWCDTSFAWEAGEESPIEAILAQVQAKHVVITGGEPLLHDLSDLLQGLQGRHVTIESNGTLPSDYEVDLYSLSPKLGSSGNAPDRAIVNAFLARFPVQLKFVVSGEEDLPAIEDFLHGLVTLDLPIYLQPEGRLGKTPEYLARVKSLVERVLARPFLRDHVRVLPQLHRLLWPNERGK